jgi:hypothetical protein
MISNIVDTDGFLVYRGNDVDTKFATVLARAGHSRVDKGNDVQIATGNKAKWNGTAWEEFVVPKTYTELRRKAYPPVGDQLDALWKGGQPQADMKLIIDGVKATYPKV